jgi:Helix-loop-helix DNA-binding domain
MRNRAEKQRRDKLNTYIAELAQINPYISESNKKMDKTSVLRLSAALMRLHKCE